MVGNIKMIMAKDAREQSKIQSSGLIEEQTSIINRYIKDRIKLGLFDVEIPICKIPKYESNRERLLNIISQLGYEYKEIINQEESDKIVLIW